jgi:O-antigen ligase
MLMAACPLLSQSRAGAVVTVGLLVASGFLLVAGLRGESPIFRAALAGFTVLVLFLGLNIGWGSLRGRMSTLDVDYQGRKEIYNTARKMAAEYPWFGTGPGTFDPLFQMYRRSSEQYWPAQLHNDWLETRITFGQICFWLMLLALGLALCRWVLPDGIRTPWPFPAFIGLALAGCLVHARVDFPLQIYSILMLFLLECAILSCISRKANY